MEFKASSTDNNRPYVMITDEQNMTVDIFIKNKILKWVWASITTYFNYFSIVPRYDNIPEGVILDIPTIVILVAIFVLINSNE